MKVYFASKNEHKFKEVSHLAPKWIELVPLPGDVPEIPEIGQTFLENALIKAVGYAKHLNRPVLADDSGLEIDALEGFPGVQSSRFMAGRSYEERMEKILRMLEGEKNRDARFVCWAVFHDPKGLTLAVRGTVEGYISTDIRGDKGFGYDPIFVPNGFEKTFGELGIEVKTRISHRSRAFKKLFELLEKINSDF